MMMMMMMMMSKSLAQLDNGFKKLNKSLKRLIKNNDVVKWVLYKNDNAHDNARG